ncbi:MAG TPA: pilus assembly protein TadG-related protein [Gemmatimonadales bacterium]|nr:pilus assembly protein TadG-related protein [Gemmatimonadales bacterium]
MRWLRRISSARLGERGVTLVMMALMMFLALGMSALAVDYGMIKSAKAEAQRAVDAAALAGASAFLIPDPTQDKVAIAEERAREYANRHMVHTVQITDPEIDVDVDLPNETVTVTYAGGDIALWFANVFGIPTMRINALAAAHVIETSNASCIMPIAIPDLWNNVDVAGAGANDPPEELVEDELWDFVDLDGNGVLSGPSGSQTERELWEYDHGVDVYDADGDGQGEFGYGTATRNGLGSNSFLNKVNDYGRQITLMTLSPKDGTTSSNYYAWGFTSNDANSGDILRAKIEEEDCQIATVGGEGYPAAAGNGATAGTISPAWDTRIGRDGDATWNDDYNRVDGSDFGDADQDGLPNSPRVVVVALYNPHLEMLAPSDNSLVFNNFAKVWIDERPAGCSGAGCKAAITGRFLGFVTGPGGGEGTTGTLIKTLQLIK